MAAKSKKKPFDITAFIKGVERPTRTLSLCFDTAVRERIEELTRQLATRPVDDEPLAGDLVADAARAELKAISDDDSLWTSVVIKAPTSRARTGLQVALADDKNTGQPVQRVQDVYASLLVDCVAAIDGNDVHLDVDQAHEILDSWPDELTQEIIEAINDMGTSVASVPLSQRLSAILTTPEPTE